MSVPTGFNELDKILNGGLHNGFLYILGARPFMGKTAFMLNIVRHLAIDEKKGFLSFLLKWVLSDLQNGCSRLCQELM